MKRLALLIFLVGGCSVDAVVGEHDPKSSLQAFPSPLLFGQTQVGTTMHRQILLANTGNTLFHFGERKTVDGPFRFQIEQTELAPAEETFIHAFFSPVEAKKSTGRIRAGIEIPAEGVGVWTSLQVHPPALQFENVLIDHHRTLEILVHNTGESRVSVTLHSVPFCHVDPEALFCARPQQLDLDGTISIEPNGMTKIAVLFRPRRAQLERVLLKLRSCRFASCTIDLPLQGVGIERNLVCRPDEVDFGAVHPGTCITKSTSCRNSGLDPVTLLGWEIAGPSRFRASSHRIQTLVPGASLPIDVTYCPVEREVAVGRSVEDTGVVVIETNHQNRELRTVTIPLRGVGGGPRIEVSSRSLNFGSTALVSPVSRTITLRNVGFADLSVSGAISDSADPQDEGWMPEPAFSAGVLSAVIPAGEEEVFPIQFQPQMEGPVLNELILTTNDRSEPEVRIDLIGHGVDLDPCTFTISTNGMLFGVVPPTHRRSRAFEVRNLGSSECLVSSIQISGDPAFSVVGEGALRIPAGSSGAVEIAYHPTSIGSHQATATLSISSPTNPINHVELSGSSADAGLLVLPESISFGSSGIGCSGRARTITIHNTSAAPATIHSVRFDDSTNAAFQIATPSFSLPRSLPPTESVMIDVLFQPTLVADHVGTIEVDATTQRAGTMFETQRVGLQGRGEPHAQQVDDFKQIDKPKVDILFVLDNSASMYEEQSSLAANFSAFIASAHALSIDYQLGVTTTDVRGQEKANGAGGRLVPLVGAPSDRIVTPESRPSPDALFASNVGVGTTGSEIEEGIEAAHLALSPHLLTSHNAGFLRDDASLSLVFVSDEPDQSARPFDFYLRYFRNLKGPQRFTASAVVGDKPNGCTGPGGTAHAGSGYIELAERTGGIYRSICTTDWAIALGDLSDSTFSFQRRFLLTQVPVEVTIRVFVNFREIFPQTGWWSYEHSSNAVLFSPFATPEPGAEIRIEYAAACN